MASAKKLSLRTSSASQSIWRDVPEDAFRARMVALEKVSKEVPNDPMVHPAKAWEAKVARQDFPYHSLPFYVENRLADDFAFVAAAKEDPKAVSAATVEEAIDGSGLVVRLAANDGVLSEVAGALKAMLELLVKCANRGLYTVLVPGL